MGHSSESSDDEETNSNHAITSEAFHSIRDRFRFKRNPNSSSTLPRVSRGPQSSAAAADRQWKASGAGRSHHHRSLTRRMLLFFSFRGKSWFYFCIFFVIFMFALASMALQSSIMSALRQGAGSERGRWRWHVRDDLKLGTSLEFKPSRRFEFGNGLDRLRSQPRIGVRLPRIGLIYALEDGNASSLWETIGKVSVLDAERYSYIDWSMYVCNVPALLYTPELSLRKLIVPISFSVLMVSLPILLKIKEPFQVAPSRASPEGRSHSAAAADRQWKASGAGRSHPPSLPHQEDAFVLSRSEQILVLFLYILRDFYVRIGVHGAPELHHVGVETRCGSERGDGGGMLGDDLKLGTSLEFKPSRRFEFGNGLDRFSGVSLGFGVRLPRIGLKMKCEITPYVPIFGIMGLDYEQILFFLIILFTTQESPKHSLIGVLFLHSPFTLQLSVNSKSNLIP
nr:uncharacterized protein LOC109187967 [Ipomoea batatas]